MKKIGFIFEGYTQYWIWQLCLMHKKNLLFPG